MTFLFTKSLAWPKRLTPSLEAFHLDTIASSFVAGTLTGVIGVIRAISYAALIFSGSLAVHLNIGVGIAIFSSAAISVVTALMSSLPGMIATPLAAPTAVLAILAAQITHTLMANGTELSTDILFTVVAAIAIGSLLTGATLWLLGTLRCGNALQFIPYPVVGGFMAATGWLLVRGAVQVMTGEALTFANLDWFIQPDPAFHWGAGLMIAVILLVMTKRFQHVLMMPGILLAATGVFYAIVWRSHLPLETIRDQGWLLGPFPSGNLWQPLTGASLGHIHWQAIAQQSNTLALLVFVSLLSLVLTNGGIELALGRDLDLNQELKAIGMANVVAGLGSTMAGNQALPSTLLVHKMGAASRFTGLFKSLPCFAVLFLGPSFLAYFPKPILGCLLLYLGMDLLWQWLYKIWFRLSPLDYLTILVTLVIVNRVGFMVGIAVGFGLTVLQFLYTCAQTHPFNIGDIGSTTQESSVSSPAAVPSAAVSVKPSALSSLSGHSETSESSVSPPRASSSTLAHLSPDQMGWIHLQGFLFFGNAAALFEQVRSRILHPLNGQVPQYLGLNFQDVLGMDASAVLSFSKLLKLAQDQQLTLVFSHVSEPLQHKLLRGQGLNLDSEHCILWERER